MWLRLHATTTAVSIATNDFLKFFLLFSIFYFPGLTTIFFCDHQNTDAHTLFPSSLIYIVACCCGCLWCCGLFMLPPLFPVALQLEISSKFVRDPASHTPAARQLNSCEFHLWGGARGVCGVRLCVRERKSAILCAFYVFRYVLWRTCLHLITVVVYTRGINDAATPHRTAPLTARTLLLHSIARLSHSIVLPNVLLQFQKLLAVFVVASRILFPLLVLQYCWLTTATTDNAGLLAGVVGRVGSWTTSPAPANILSWSTEFAFIWFFLLLLLLPAPPIVPFISYQSTMGLVSQQSLRKYFRF